MTKRVLFGKVVKLYTKTDFKKMTGLTTTRLCYFIDHTYMIPCPFYMERKSNHAYEFNKWYFIHDQIQWFIEWMNIYEISKTDGRANVIPPYSKYKLKEGWMAITLDYWKFLKDGFIPTEEDPLQLVKDYWKESSGWVEQVAIKKPKLKDLNK